MAEEHEGVTPKNENLETASGESLDEVLSTIRETVSAHVGGAPSSLANALNDLRAEINNLQNKIEGSGEASFITARTLENIITKTAKPMLEIILRNWVEKNLPHLAEQIIREEIEKIYRER